MNEVIKEEKYCECCSKWLCRCCGKDQESKDDGKMIDGLWECDECNRYQNGSEAKKEQEVLYQKQNNNKMSQLIMFGYNTYAPFNQNIIMDGTYNNLEECVKMVETLEKNLSYQYYIVYSNEHIKHDDEWKHKWYLKKVLVSKHINSSSSAPPNPLYRCYSNDLRTFYFN